MNSTSHYADISTHTHTHTHNVENMCDIVCMQNMNWKNNGCD